MNNHPAQAKILVISGPFGSGKSTVSQLAASALRGFGKTVQVVALDEVSKQVVNDNLMLRHELADAFGDEVLNEDTSLNRSTLADIAFADEQSTTTLNEIVHPPTVELARHHVAATLEAEGLPIIEMPFPATHMAGVFEQSGAKVIVWAVQAHEDARIGRGLSDGYSLKDVLRRMSRQPHEDDYIAEANVLIRNDGDLADLLLTVQANLQASHLIYPNI